MFFMQRRIREQGRPQLPGLRQQFPRSLEELSERASAYVESSSATSSTQKSNAIMQALSDTYWVRDDAGLRCLNTEEYGGSKHPLTGVQVPYTGEVKHSLMQRTPAEIASSGYLIANGCAEAVTLFCHLAQEHGVEVSRILSTYNPAKGRPHQLVEVEEAGEKHVLDPKWMRHPGLSGVRAKSGWDEHGLKEVSHPDLEGVIGYMRPTISGEDRVFWVFDEIDALPKQGYRVRRWELMKAFEERFGAGRNKT